MASWSAQGQPSVRRITSGFAPEIVGDVRGRAFAGVSYSLDRIPPCSAWPLNMLMDQGSFTIG